MPWRNLQNLLFSMTKLRWNMVLPVYTDYCKILKRYQVQRFISDYMRSRTTDGSGYFTHDGYRIISGIVP